MHITRLSYSRYLLWIRAVRFRDFVWLLKVAMFYLASLFIPYLWSLRDRVFPPKHQVVFLRIKGNRLMLIWKDVTLLYALSEVFFRGFYDVRSLQGNEVILDLGASVGIYTFYVIDKVKNGLIVAVEPEPHNRLLLQLNLKINKIPNVIVVGKAISDRAGFARLYISPYTGSHSIIDEHGKQWKAVKTVVVPTTTVDDLVEELGLSKVDIIKMDIEGAEYLALKGAMKTLKENRNLKIIISAEHDPEVKKQCLALLKYLGFKIKLNNHIVYAYR